jgi:hypothetical protein
MAVPHETIDDAVADAVSGVWSIIHIEEGLYAEPRFEFTNADDQLAFIGIGEVEWSVDSGDEVLEVVDAQVFLQGLTLNGDKRGLVCEGDARCTGRQLIIRGSSERGIRTKDRAVVDLDRVFVTGNEGGGIIAEGAVKIRAVNSIFANNGSRSKEGGAIYLKGEKAVLELFNSTLADNQATDAAGAVSVEKIDKLPPITAANLLLWNNSTDGDGLECMGCDLGADSLQGEDPLFWMADGERADALDYRINSLSPARGRAKTLSILEQWDYFGNDRGGGAWDSGAHEFQ